MSTAIAINGVGPVVDFEYELADPGIHVIRGDSGSGKTTILRTVELATGGKVEKPTKMDGVKSGTASIGDRRLRIGKVVREEGDLSLEGLADLDLASLHTPKFQNAHTRDNHRIKALVRLAKVTPDVSLFHELLGTREEFDGVVDADAVSTDDLVEMSAKVKRAIEKAAQAQERQAETARANQRSKSELFAGVDLKAPHDQKKLQDAQVAAIERKSAIAQKRVDALEVLATAKIARDNLAEADAGATDIESAKQELESAVAARKQAESVVEELERQLTEARHKLEVAEINERSAESTLLDAERHAEVTADWRTAIEAAEGIECPTEEDVAEASAAVDAANAAVELGKTVRDALQAKTDAERYAELAKGYEQAAKRYRTAAAATQDVLSDAISRIPNCPLRVWNDDSGNSRLVLETDRSEREPFDDLSDGERYDVLMPMLFRNGRLLVLSQAGFGELSPAIRHRVHEGARRSGTFVLTAQADSGSLRAELYQPELEEAEAAV